MGEGVPPLEKVAQALASHDGALDIVSNGSSGGAGLLASLSSSRQRSASPWASRLARPSALTSSGLLTPARHLRDRCASPSIASNGLNCGAASIRQATSRAAYENAVLGAVRKQIDGLEEKVGVQISKVQQNTERFKLDTLSRLEEKISTNESAQMRTDRRIAEFNGKFKGLDDEVQAQIRSFDTLDGKMSDWRNQFEEHLKAQLAVLEDRVVKATSSANKKCSNLEDAHTKHNQRLSSMERDLQERLEAHQETRDDLLHIQSRIEAVEDNATSHHFMLQQVTSQHSPMYTEAEDCQAAVAICHKQVSDITDKVNQMCEESAELHASAKKQEVEMQSCRTMLTTRDDHIRRLSDRLEAGDWEAKFEQVRRAVLEDKQSRVEQFEKMQTFIRKLEFQEQAYEELRSRHDQILRHPNMSAHTMHCAAETLEDCTFRVASCEAQLVELADHMSALHASAECPLVEQQQLAVILARLQEIMPKVEATLASDHESLPFVKSS